MNVCVYGCMAAGVKRGERRLKKKENGGKKKIVVCQSAKILLKIFQIF